MKVKIPTSKSIFFLKFLDEMLGNFSLSPSLPEVVAYVIHSKNPLLEVLADQIYQDPRMQNLSGNYLITCILEALEKGVIPWLQEEFSMIEYNEWSKKMKIDPIFYQFHAKSGKEMIAYEIGLLKLASNFLRKRIILVPLLKTDPLQTIEPLQACTGQYHIAFAFGRQLLPQCVSKKRGPK